MKATKKKAKKAAEAVTAAVPATAPALAEKQQAIRALMHAMNSDERKIIVPADEVPNPYVLRRPTGIIELDIDLGGGFPAGGCSIVSGPDNCVAANTIIYHEVHTPSGKRVTHKPITIERLYERFHGLKVPGRGKNQKRSLNKNTGIFYAPSINDERGILQNRILDVVSTGEKECYELITERGYKIRATDAHKFFNGERYVTLASLKPGDTVYVHNNTRKTAATKAATGDRVLLYVKHHPTAYRKVVRDKKRGYRHTYRVLARARAVVEAHMNGLALSDYISLLNQGKLTELVFLRANQLVHHQDEDTTNDSLENLAVMSRADHMQEHLRDPKRDNYFRFLAVPDTVKSIRHVGRQRTYDMKMAGPFHNYIANHFVVHNSGKTWLVMRTIAMQQKLFGHNCNVAIGITEGGFPFDQAINAGVKVAVPDYIIRQWSQWRQDRQMSPFSNEELVRFKEQVGRIDLIRGYTGEEILQGMLECVRINAYNIVACDSYNGLQPQDDAGKQLDENEKRAAQANMMGKFFKHYVPLTTSINGVNETTVLFTAQVRSNQERAFAPAHMQQYIKPWVPSGAWASKHYKLIELMLWDGKTLKKGEGENRQAIGKMLNWLLEKGKAGTHDNKGGDVAFYYAHGGVDIIGELMTSGIKRGVLQQRGSKWVVVQPDTKKVLEEFTAPSQKALHRMVEADFEFELALRRELLATEGIQCLYR